MMNTHLKRVRKELLLSVGSVCLALSLSTPAYAADHLTLEQHPVIKNPVWMKDAVQVRITPRGQKLFSEQLMLILTNLGVVVDENYFPEFDYVSDQPIKIDELAKKQPEEFEMLLKVRQFFKQYLQGIQFKDFKPSIKIGASDYVADFNRLSIVTDEELMKSLGKSDGAVLSIEISVRSLKAKTKSVTAKDLENPWIGQIGVQAAEVKMGSNETPLVARMPFYVRVDENGILQFEALKIEENIDRVPIEIKYKRIVLPEFEFKVVGQNGVHKIKLNEDEFKKIVDEHLPDGLKMIRRYVREFLQTELPKTLNKQAQDSLKSGLEQIQSLPAPNTSATDTRPPLSLGLKLSKINLVNSQWAVGLSAFIEDTSLMKMTPFWEKSGSRGAPVFNHLDASQYDLAIAVDRALFNRAIHLATNRKNFKKLETCPGQPAIELMSGPSIDFNPSASTTNDLETSIAMYVDAQVDVPEDMRSRWGIPILEDKLRLTMRYQAIMKPAEVGSAMLSITPTGADLKTLKIVSGLRTVGKMFEGKVRSEIEKILSGSSSCGTNEPLAKFELINSLWGIPLEYAKLKMDSQGQLMMYMNYKKVNPGNWNQKRK